MVYYMSYNAIFESVFTQFVYAYFIALFIMISYIGGQETLYCSHETLHLSILEPSVFTQISGTQLCYVDIVCSC